MPPQRAVGYGTPAPAAYGDWKTHHEGYLQGEVFRIPPDEGRPKTIDLDDEDLCPQTFRLPARSPYAHSNPKLHLLRLVELNFLHRKITPQPPYPQLRAEAQAALGQPEGSAAYQRFDRLLGIWQKNIDLRPVYAAYWEDMADLFGEEPGQDRPDWAEQMRDRLGLAHLDPGERGGPIDVLVFRYAIEELPPVRQWRDSAPLMPPTVLDGLFSAAFCPAPANAATGHVVHLAGGDARLRREVLHPAMDYHGKHLWRVGRLEKPVRREDLPTARAIHLASLRDQCGRPDYAETTDGDLLA